MTARTCAATDRLTSDDRHLKVLRTDRSLHFLFREMS